MKYIAVDFDNTMTNGENWPECGEENPYAIEVIKRLQDDGHKIILNTCRTGGHLSSAIDWMKSKGLIPDAINDNPWCQQYYKEYGPCRKIFADLYIDDKNIFVKKTSSGSLDFKWIKDNYENIFD